MKCYMKYAVNEAGVSALQNISTTLMTSVADLFEKTSQLQTITSDNEDSLGPHKASLNQAIMEIYRKRNSVWRNARAYARHWCCAARLCGDGVSGLADHAICELPDWFADEAV